MSDVDDLVVWLRAQLDDDEQLALAADPGPWVVGSEWGAATTRVYVKAEYSPLDTVGTCVFAAQIASKDGGRENAAHIARHDPAAVLADIAAKRCQLEYWELTRRRLVEVCDVQGVSSPRSAEAAAAALDDVVTALGSAYATRPGYRDDWRPSESA